LQDVGLIEQTLARQSKQMGQPLPERISNAPELYDGLQIYLQAFNDLDSERSHAMGITQIPWSAIINYAKVNDFSQDQTDDLVYLVRAMDSEHCKKLDAKQKSKNGSKSERLGQ